MQRDGHRVHGRQLEQPDRLVDVDLLHGRVEAELGQAFGDADDGLELAARASGRQLNRSGRTDRTVMGIDERSLLSRSICWTCLRRATKCELDLVSGSLATRVR